MKNIFIYIMIFLLSCLAINQSYAANRKIAQTGFQFLSVVSDARASAMANAVNSIEMQSSSLFFNPAGIANMSNFIDIAVSDNQWIADIHHNTVSFAINPTQGKLGVIGVSLQYVDYGEFQGTIVDKTLELGYRETGTFQPSALALGFGYAKALSDRFSVGGQVKWAHQDFGDLTYPSTDSTLSTKTYDLSPIAFDFGTLFKTNLKSLVFGMSVRNFSGEVEYEQEGFQLPLVFTIGISMDVMDFTNLSSSDHSLHVSIDANHFRSHPEQLLVGLDYKIRNILSLRGGYIVNSDEENFSFGVGVSYFGITFDYAYTPFGLFNNAQRMTARFSM